MQQQLQLLAFLEAFEKKNKELNLVSYQSRHELETKHLGDSLALLKIFDLGDGQRVLDLGAGGGFPGIPLAIMSPDAELVLMDSTGKKMQAVEDLAKEIGLSNLSTLTGRFEDLGHDLKYRETFGLVTARAVASLPTLLEYAAPFVCVHGLFVAYKSADYQEEFAASLNAQKVLGLEFEGPIDYELSDDMGSRSLLVFRKTEPIDDAYPRKVGLPKKRPL
jgi:16S rRNA (guanine527-N7)-methyltransferase